MNKLEELQNDKVYKDIVRRIKKRHIPYNRGIPRYRDSARTGSTAGRGTTGTGRTQLPVKALPG